MDRTGVATPSERLLSALLAGDRIAVAEMIDAALAIDGDGVALLDDLLAPAMREVGSRWECGEITVADEHRATALAHSTLTRVYPSLVTAPPCSRGRVLLAGADGERHVLGLRIVADVLEGAGFDVRNTGAALAPAALAAALERHRPVLVGLADTMGDGLALHRSIDAVRAIDSRLPILLGGAGAGVLAAGDPRIAVCASARDALRSAERLLAG